MPPNWRKLAKSAVSDEHSANELANAVFGIARPVVSTWMASSKRWIEESDRDGVPTDVWLDVKNWLERDEPLPRHISTFEDLVRIFARRRCLDFFRKQKKKRPEQPLFEELTCGKDSRIEAQVELKEELAYAVSQLSVVHQRIFHLWALGDTVEEMSESTGRTTGSIRGLIHRMKRTLRSLLACSLEMPFDASRSGEAVVEDDSQ